MFGRKKKKENRNSVYSEIAENEFIETEEDDRINDIRGTIHIGDCLYCHGKNTMTYGGSYFLCSKCNHSVGEDIYYRWYLGYPVEVQAVYDESYEEIYDEDGDYANVQCNYCSETMRWKNGQYICPNCGNVMSRAEFFNAIGANPPGPNCLICNNLYPGCLSCPYGYETKDD